MYNMSKIIEVMVTTIIILASLFPWKQPGQGIFLNKITDIKAEKTAAHVNKFKFHSIF